MANLTISTLTEDGDTIALASAAGAGDEYVNDRKGNTFIYIDNQDASSTTVTATVQNTSVVVDGYGTLTKTDRVVAVPAGEQRWIGPLPQAFNDSNGRVQLTYSSVVSLSVAAVKV
jgi:hypothetical protein